MSDKTGENLQPLPLAFDRYLARIGAETVSFDSFVVKEWVEFPHINRRYYKDLCWIKITPEGELKWSKPGYEPTEAEAEELRPAILREYLADKPKPITATVAGAEEIRRERGIKSENFFPCVNNARSEVIWVQWRKGDGKDKRYYPLTLFNDGVWRDKETGGLRAFWKPLKDRNKVKLMIHEGAKAASYVDWMCNANEIEAKEALKRHPWGEDLKSYEHWGIMGGALSPHCADWDEVRRMKSLQEVVYACDRDRAGEDALVKVSRIFGERLIGIRVDDRFGDWGWDMADPLPEELYRKNKAGVKCYVGPTLEQMMQPATWATEEVTIDVGGKKKKFFALKKTFCEEWFHSVTPEAFVHKRFPSTVYYSAKEFNSRVAPFSDVTNVAALLIKIEPSKVAELDYNPSTRRQIITEPRRAFNTYRPTHIRWAGLAGSAQPWEDFLAHLFPVVSDRAAVEDWIATLIARPDIRMRYGLLLISETQGVGKSTLAEILGVTVGVHNASHPTEYDIAQSPFNDWKNRKRLVIVHEIYQGESAKVYNKLKDTITEDKFTVNRKNVPQHEMPNWSHIVACSNSPRALLLPDEDRRWLVPETTEELLPVSYWEEFYQWLETGGYGIIVRWAFERLDKREPVSPAQHAPRTDAKMKMIEENYSPGKQVVADRLAVLPQLIFEDAKREAKLNGTKLSEEPPKVIVTTDKALVEFIRLKLYEGRSSDKLEREMTVRRVAKAKGWYVGKNRVYVEPLRQHATLIANVPRIVERTYAQLKEWNDNRERKPEEKIVFLETGAQIRGFDPT